MTDPLETPQGGQHEVPPQGPLEEPLTDPQETQHIVQQLREAGFSADQQAALTTALLRVLALWTQQATRGDLHAAQQALEQCLAQQLDALRAELQGACVRQAELLHATRGARARGRDGLRWLRTALLALTCAGVVFLVLLKVLGR